MPDERAAAGYAGALAAARVTVCRLHAGPGELARRISRRGQGLSWPQPGDPLIGQPEARLRLVAAEAAAEAAALERSGLGDLRIDTDGRTAAEVADLVARRWPKALMVSPGQAGGPSSGPVAIGRAESVIQSDQEPT